MSSVDCCNTGGLQVVLEDVLENQVGEELSKVQGLHTSADSTAMASHYARSRCSKGLQDPGEPPAGSR